MIAMSFGIILISILLYLIYRRHQKMIRKYPPGPTSLPFVGSIPFLNTKNGNAAAVLDQAFYKISSDMYTVWLGSTPLIVIQDFNLAKDMFSREEFCGRIFTHHDKYVRGKGGHSLGIVATVGSFWQEQRRFSLKHLKDLGFGKQKLETIIQDEIQYLIDEITSKAEHGDVLFDTVFNFPIINILWQIIASKRYDPNLPESKRMMEKVTEFFKMGIPALVFIMEPIRHLLPLFKIDKMILDLKAMFRCQVLEQLEEYNCGGFHEPRNFIDIYLKEIKEQEITQQPGVNQGNYSTFNTEQLVTICLDFFQAGSETSSTTLSWAILYLALYPDIQEKCWKEIEQNLGGK